jgi:RNA polymerase sigma-70 factor (ECF subfamily)
MELVEHLFRHSKGRMIAALTKVFGVHNIDLAEDVTQEAFKRALETWPIRGVPPDPAGWLMVTARNRALDIVRKEKGIRTFSPEHDLPLQSGWIAESHLDGVLGPAAIKDDELRLMFSCCHTALSEEAQVALILYLLSGFSVGEIASAYVSSTSAIEKRISRSKQVLAKSQALFVISRKEEFENRLPSVQRAIYLLFNEGYHGASPESAVRSQLCHEAMRLADLILAHPFGSQSSTFALAALMSLNAAKLPARLSSKGELTSLHDQDRSEWDSGLIVRGMECLAKSASGEEVTEYHIEALLAANHIAAPSIEATNWESVGALYDQLLILRPSPIVFLNRAIAVGYRDGVGHGLEAIHSIPDRSRLAHYPFYWAAQAEFEMKVGQIEEAREHFLEASKLARNDQERCFFQGRIQSLA